MGKMVQQVHQVQQDHQDHQVQQGLTQHYVLYILIAMVLMLGSLLPGWLGIASLPLCPPAGLLLLVGWAEAGARLGLTARARIRSFVSLGAEPQLMLDGPTPACERALRHAGLAASDIDLWELNEAFAAVPLRLMDTLSIPHERINVNGGAIAMGHPLGASGAMIAGTLIDELERRGAGLGMVTLCAAGGMAIAMVVERVG